MGLRCREGRVDGVGACHVESKFEDVVCGGEVGECGWVAGCGDEAERGFGGDEGCDSFTDSRGTATYLRLMSNSISNMRMAFMRRGTH